MAIYPRGPTTAAAGGMAQMHRRNLLLAVARTAPRLVAASDWRPAIEAVLADIGTAVRADRALLLRLDYDQAGEPRWFTVECDWTAAEHGWPANTLRRMFYRTPIRGHGYDCSRWLATLLAGEAFLIGEVHGMNDGERALMRSAGVRSGIRVPVFARRRLWGALGFDSLSHQRVWLGAEVIALWALARIVGAAVEAAR